MSTLRRKRLPSWLGTYRLAPRPTDVSNKCVEEPTCNRFVRLIWTAISLLSIDRKYSSCPSGAHRGDTPPRVEICTLSRGSRKRCTHTSCRPDSSHAYQNHRTYGATW